MIEFHDKPATLNSVDLSKYIDDKKETIRSLTGELVWNYGIGVATVDTPLAQGAAGFLNQAGRIKLSDVVIDSQNDYGSVLVVSLDGKPLKHSAKVLIQAGTWDTPQGFETEPVGEYEKINKLGGFPLNVRRIKAKVILPSGKQATVLDENGYPSKRKAKTTSAGGKLTVTLPQDSLYTVIR